MANDTETIKARLQADLTLAMKARDEIATSTIRMLRAAITNAEVAGSEAIELTDAQAIAVLQSEAKKRVEAAEVYEQAGRAESAAKERAELVVIERYLPAAMSDAELRRDRRRGGRGRGRLRRDRPEGDGTGDQGRARASRCRRRRWPDRSDREGRPWLSCHQRGARGSASVRRLVTTRWTAVHRASVRSAGVRHDADDPVIDVTERRDHRRNASLSAFLGEFPAAGLALRSTLDDWGWDASLRTEAQRPAT